MLQWYKGHKRRLPWRSNPTPYHVWLSEIMLQQTQVRTVLPYYEKFLRRFPDVRALAAASEDEVLAQWAGLGYYSRARNLHRAARIMVRDCLGGFPDNVEETLRLPGIGRYTAGAIQSIAFNRPQPIVDGNIRRVISRLHGIEHRAPERFFWKQASAWIARENPADSNQAVMELGALICVPSDPRCPACPVSSLCAATQRGIQNRIPPSRPTRALENVTLVMLVIEHDECVLLCRKLPVSYIPGPWGLPTRLLQAGETPRQAVLALAHAAYLDPAAAHRTVSLRHSITYRRIVAHVFRARNATRPSKRIPGCRWVARAESDHFLTSSLFRKALKV